jgi:hypothetical protein
VASGTTPIRQRRERCGPMFRHSSSFRTHSSAKRSRTADTAPWLCLPAGPARPVHSRHMSRQCGARQSQAPRGGAVSECTMKRKLAITVFAGLAMSACHAEQPAPSASEVRYLEGHQDQRDRRGDSERRTGEGADWDDADHHQGQRRPGRRGALPDRKALSHRESGRHGQGSTGQGGAVSRCGGFAGAGGDDRYRLPRSIQDGRAHRLWGSGRVLHGGAVGREALTIRTAV